LGLALCHLNRLQKQALFQAQTADPHVDPNNTTARSKLILGRPPLQDLPMPDNNIRHLARLSLQDAMRLFGLTARALRYYEEIGLLEAQRDRINHRFYGPQARRRLEWIAPLRAAGLGIDDIRKVIHAEETEGRGRDFALARLQALRTKLCRAMTDVDAAIGAYDAPRTRPLQRTV